MSSPPATRCWGIALAAVLSLPLAARGGAAGGQAVPAASTRYTAAWRQPVAPGSRLDVLLAPTTVMLSAADAGLTARSRDDGGVVWTTPVSTAVPVLAGDMVLVSSNDQVLALEEATGRERWSVTVGAAVFAMTPASDRLIIVTASELIALRVADGYVLWRAGLGASPVTSVSVDGALAVVGLDSPALLGVDVATGITRWRTPLDSAPLAPTASQGRIYLGLRSHHACAFKQESGSLDWCFAIRAPIVGAPAVDDRHVYVAVLDNTVRVFDRRHGALTKRLSVSGRPIAGPQQLDTSLAVPLISGELAVVRPAPPTLTPSGLLPAPQADESLQTAALAADGTSVVRLTVAVAGTRQVTMYRRTVDTAPGMP